MLAKRIWIGFTSAMLEGLEESVKKGYASDMNSAVRDAVREYLKELGLWQKRQ